MIQYNKTPALQAIIHLFGEEGAQMFKKSTVDLNSAFYPQPAFYSHCAVCILQSVFTLTGFVFNCAFQKHANYEVQSQLTFAFFATVNHFSGPLGKQKFTLTCSKGNNS